MTGEIGIVLSVVAALFAAAVCVYLWGVSRAVSAAVRPTGTPTPEEARIIEQTKADARAIVDEGERAKKEVQLADRDALLDALRNELRK